MRLKVITAALGVCAVVAVTASAQSAPPTKEPGKLIVGFDVPAPGFWNGRVSGTTLRNPSGFEHSLSLAIAKQLKIPEVEFLRAPFGTPLLARTEEVRLRVRGGHDHRPAEEGRRLLDALLRREPGRSRRQGHTEAHARRPAQVPADVRAEGHDRAHLDTEQAAAGASSRSPTPHRPAPRSMRSRRGAAMP